MLRGPRGSPPGRGGRDGGPCGRAMMAPQVSALLAAAVTAGTPLVFAGIGELLAERSGVLNLGVEGMMLMGAVTAFWVSQRLGGPAWLVLLVAVVVAAVAGPVISLMHRFVTITPGANPIGSGR